MHFENEIHPILCHLASCNKFYRRMQEREEEVNKEQ